MKKNLKYLLALCLTIALVFSLAACGQKADETTNDAQDDQQTEQEEFTPTSYSIAALKGPTAMGLVKLMKDSESGETTGNEYTFTLAGSADEVTPALLKGELDMACVPANLAAVLYNKTEGEIEVLAVNTLGVLYIVENGESVHSMADLKGKTIVAAGKGSTPEYALRYLLTENGIDPDNDVTIDWKSEHSECVAALASGQASVALLPQPFVTVAQSKLEGLRMALDLTEEWDKLDNGSALITGVIVAIPTAWSDEYQNITVNMVAGGLEDYVIQCFRLTGEGAKDLKEGDEITVTGILKNYKGTVEFDKGCTLQ